LGVPPQTLTYAFAFAPVCAVGLYAPSCPPFLRAGFPLQSLTHVPTPHRAGTRPRPTLIFPATKKRSPKRPFIKSKQKNNYCLISLICSVCPSANKTRTKYTCGINEASDILSLALICLSSTTAPLNV
jgi:hypothetical protein